MIPTPGAPDATMTPEQCARKIASGKWNGRLDYDLLEKLIVEAIREAEASALRRAAEVARSFYLPPQQGLSQDHVEWANRRGIQIEAAIEALIPTSLSAESANG